MITLFPYSIDFYIKKFLNVNSIPDIDQGGTIIAICDYNLQCFNVFMCLFANTLRNSDVFKSKLYYECCL